MGVGISEELWFGGSERPERDTEERAAKSMAAMVGRIIGAKPFPEAARRLADLTKNPRVKIDDVVRVLESDPALCARLLRLVNSAGYSLRLRCTSVRHAATLVGSERLNQIATTAAVLDLFEANSELALGILEHTTVVGALARYLAAHVNLPADDLFTCGFLHDIGKLMLLESEKDTYAELLLAHGGQADVLHVVEREIFGFDHAVLAAHVLQAWEIPDPVPKVVAYHHDPIRAQRAGTMVCSMVHTLRLADALAYALRDERTDPDELVVRIARSEAASYLDISEPQLASMWPDLRGLEYKAREQANGGEAIEVSSITPRTASVKKHAPTQETPKQFPCVACDAPSFGNTCDACGGHVCPKHQEGESGWCSLCDQDYVGYVKERTFPLTGQVLVGAVTTGMVLASVVGAWASDSTDPLRLVLGPLSAMALITVVVLVVRRSSLRSRFLRERPNRYRPAVEAPTSHASLLPAPPAPAEKSSDLRTSLIDSLSGSAPRASIPIGSLQMEDDAMLRELRRLTLGTSQPPPSFSLAPIQVREVEGGGFGAPSLLPDGAIQSLPPDASVMPAGPAVVLEKEGKRARRSRRPDDAPSTSRSPSALEEADQREELRQRRRFKKLESKELPAVLGAGLSVPAGKASAPTPTAGSASLTERATLTGLGPSPLAAVLEQRAPQSRPLTPADTVPPEEHGSEPAPALDSGHPGAYREPLRSDQMRDELRALLANAPAPPESPAVSVRPQSLLDSVAARVASSMAQPQSVRAPSPGAPAVGSPAAPLLGANAVAAPRSARSPQINVQPAAVQPAAVQPADVQAADVPPAEPQATPAPRSKTSRRPRDGAPEPQQPRTAPAVPSVPVTPPLASLSPLDPRSIEALVASRSSDLPPEIAERVAAIVAERVIGEVAERLAESMAERVASAMMTSLAPRPDGQPSLRAPRRRSRRGV